MCASARLSKLERWGYLIRTGSEPSSRRPRALYSVTQKGMECKIKEGWKSKFERLAEAVRVHLLSSGDRSRKQLVKIFGEVTSKE